MPCLFLQAWMDLYAGGLGGAQPPPCANKMIRATFLYCKHDEDMMLFCIASITGLEHVGGGWVAQAPPCASNMIHTTYPSCKHCDDMFVFPYCKRGWTPSVETRKYSNMKTLFMLLRNLLRLRCEPKAAHPGDSIAAYGKPKLSDNVGRAQTKILYQRCFYYCSRYD